ncbi:hypothetical protein F5876DRAFT_69736 [Lentinula aff. lateritia]|uniref:Uncharacterized protein n=1 Tax=Lentinula aff. lateritia TaxID=2804960 RepID=A0ACC1TL84_9AGAR|nr:hypothetical protein F5876DRAFT_69736 [Lentinula aff. lateritia]
MPATIQSPGEHQPLDNTMGAMLVGIIVSAVLYGISLVQTLFYFNRYRDDACDNGQLDFMIWSVLAEAVPTGFTGALVQTFYTVRVWRLSKKNHVLAVVIMLIVLAQTAWVIISLQLSTFQQLLGISDLTISINALSTAADVIIAASLCFLLAKSRTGFKHSDTMINKLVYSVRGEYWIFIRGCVDSVCAIASLLSLIASPKTLLYAPFYFCIGRLYSNSLLATLNARNQIRNGSNDAEHMMVSLSQASRDHAVLPTNSKNLRPQNISIRIDTAKDYASDGKEDESSSVTF